MTLKTTFADPKTADLKRAIRFPRLEGDLSQNEEWFEFNDDGRWHRLRIHDYHEIFKVPRLYEDLVYRTLKCTSPRRVARWLAQVLEDHSQSPEDLRVLDLGAGNGIVAEQLRKVGVGYVLGLDLLEQAKQAADRDRPDVYDDYLVADLCDLSPDASSRLDKANLNCLSTVAALGFGDIPARAFAEAVNCIESPGWVAMAIKDDFLSSEDNSGFSRLIRRLMAEGIFEVQAQIRYCHRLSLAGEKLFYVALIARKMRDIPNDLITDLESHHEPVSSDSDKLITDTLERTSP